MTFDAPQATRLETGFRVLTIAIFSRGNECQWLVGWIEATTIRMEAFFAVCTDDKTAERPLNFRVMTPLACTGLALIYVPDQWANETEWRLAVWCLSVCQRVCATKWPFGFQVHFCSQTSHLRDFPASIVGGRLFFSLLKYLTVNKCMKHSTNCILFMFACINE